MDKSILQRIWVQLSKRRKIQLGGLLALMLGASLAEVFSLGSVIPFLSTLVAPEQIFHHSKAQFFIRLLKVQTADQLLLPLTLIFGSLALIAGVIRILLNYVQLRLAHAIGAEFGGKIFERTLYQPYIVHISRNSSEILAGVEKGSRIIQLVLLPLLQSVSASILVLAIVITLTAINPVVSLSAFAGFLILYWALFTASRVQLKGNSQTIANNANEYNKTIQEGLGGIRDILLDGTQLIFAKHFQKTFFDYQTKQASNQAIALVPRYGVEAIGLLLIAILAYWLTTAESGILGAIPVLGALALGAQRMLPLIQMIYGALVSMKGGKNSVKDALTLLEQPMSSRKNVTSITFNNQIEFRKVGFRYQENTPYVLEDFSLVIPKGSRIGIKGITGSGKSTLLDITMGLLQPQKGALWIDGVPLDTYSMRRSWQAHIAHVPQSIFLSATTIAENIAFGVPKHMIDLNRVKLCAEMAQIAGTIENWPKGYDTQVGERGIRLSGGQRQRIGIARALYKNVDVLILDEATSALDQATEQAVMQAIQALNPQLTIIMVAHRLSTLENCDFIVEK